MWAFSGASYSPGALGAVAGTVFLFSALAVLLESYLLVQHGATPFMGIVGLCLGRLSGSLLGYAASLVLTAALGSNAGPAGAIAFLLLTVAFAWLGTSLGVSRGSGFGFAVDGERRGSGPGEVESIKILDTSVVIDGRIGDIAASGFLEGVLVVPKFVLKELQQVADSGDALKRSRGRRGLDILNGLKSSKDAKIKFVETDYEDTPEVDSKLLLLARDMGGVVVTNDYNLNKVAGIQGAKVLNINDLASAVRPVVLPNEELRIAVIREGKVNRQGIAYLDDGTIIVVDDGMRRIGKEVDVVVTSILQTEAGRMLFTEIVDPKLRNQNSGGGGRREGGDARGGRGASGPPARGGNSRPSTGNSPTKRLETRKS